MYVAEPGESRLIRECFQGRHSLDRFWLTAGSCLTMPGCLPHWASSKKRTLGGFELLTLARFAFPQSPISCRVAQYPVGVVEITKLCDFHTLKGSLNRVVHHAQGKYAEAGPLHERCQAIQEKVLGPEHPSLAITLSNRAKLLQSQVRAVRHNQGCSSGLGFG